MNDAQAVPTSTGPDPLVATACAKAGLLWVGRPGQRPLPLWHVWHVDAIGLVVGGTEQPDPGLVDGALAEVQVPSKDNGGRLLVFAARVHEVRPDSERWEPLTFALKAGRLNAPDADTMVERWSAGSRVLLLVPEGGPTEAPGQYDDASGAATPPPTPATTDNWRPFHAGGRKRRRYRMR